LAEQLGLLAEEVQGGEEAFGHGGVQRDAFEVVGFAVGLEVAEGVVVGEDAGQGVDGGGEANQGGGVVFAGIGVGLGPVGAGKRVGGCAGVCGGPRCFTSWVFSCFGESAAAGFILIGGKIKSVRMVWWICRNGFLFCSPWLCWLNYRAAVPESPDVDKGCASCKE
jgi:hypothetical protein